MIQGTPVYKTDKKESIEYILFPFQENCTICLSFHENPKMLRCGHVFCFPCIKESYKQYSKKCILCNKTILNYKSINSLDFEIKKNCLPINLNQEKTNHLLKENNKLDEILLECLIDVKFDFYDEIKIGDIIVMKKLLSFDIKDTFIKDRNENPFSSAYYINQKVENSRKESVLLNSNLELNFLNSEQYKGFNRSSVTQKIIDNVLKSRDNQNCLNSVFYQIEDGQLVFLDPELVSNLKNKYKKYSKMPEILLIKVISIKKTKVSEKSNYPQHVEPNKSIKLVVGDFII